MQSSGIAGKGPKASGYPVNLAVWLRPGPLTWSPVALSLLLCASATFPLLHVAGFSSAPHAWKGSASGSCHVEFLLTLSITP